MSAFFSPSASPHFSFSAPILPHALSRSTGSSGPGWSTVLAPNLNMGALWTRVPLGQAQARDDRWGGDMDEQEVTEPELVMPNAYKR